MRWRSSTICKNRVRWTQPEIDSSVFPDGTNVGSWSSAARRARVDACPRTGCGETLSCGTGICAVGRTGPSSRPTFMAASIRVDVPGGAVQVRRTTEGTLVLTGPAELVARPSITPTIGDVPLADPRPANRGSARRPRALRRIPGLSTELEDISEVEYRQVRLERVVWWACGPTAAPWMHNVRCRNSPGWPRPPDRWCSKAWCSAGQSPILRRMCRIRQGHRVARHRAGHGSGHGDL